MRSFLSHKLVLLIAAVALAAAAGGAYAATSSSSGTSPQAFLNDVARRLHVTPAQLRQALQGASVDRLQALVAAGDLTQAQANRLEQAIRDRRLGPGLGVGPWMGAMPFLHAGPGSAYGWRFRHAFPGRFGPPLMPGAMLGIGVRIGARAAESYLGLTRAQLLSDLRSGKSLAEIARARGRTAAGLQSAIEAAYRTRLSALVSRGLLTPAQERELLAHVKVMLGRAISHPLPLPGPGAGPGWGRFRMFHGARPWARPGAAGVQVAPPAPASVAPAAGMAFPQ